MGKSDSLANLLRGAAAYNVFLEHIGDRDLKMLTPEELHSLITDACETMFGDNDCISYGGITLFKPKTQDESDRLYNYIYSRLQYKYDFIIGAES